MNHQDFNEFLKQTQEIDRDVLIAKNDEYAPGNDKLANFKKGGNAMGTTAQECLWGYAMKHIISIQDIVFGEGSYTPEKMSEKAGDARRYLILLEALLLEIESNGQA